MISIKVATICSLVTIMVESVDVEPIVQLPNGRIQGKTAKSSNKNSFYSFQEIPYAEPPVGNLRFQPPEAKGNWSGILKTQQNTKICHQVPVDNVMENEDCLYLNVYTPDLSLSESLPVLFFIHGGGFVEGNAIYANYGPQRLMDYDIVVVSFNYRLGPFGFLSTGDTIIPGNNGLRDQKLALEWVQDNIQLFGGDPQKVTIYGQSAGAASVSYHLLSQKSSGLFRSAILSSGSALSPWAMQRNARKYAYQAASYISLFNYLLKPEALKTALTSISATDLDQAAKNLEESVSNEQMVEGFFFGPVLEPEHEDAFLTQKMYEQFAAGNFTKVPTLIGICSEEGSYRLLDPQGLKTKVANYDKKIQYLATDDFNILNATRRKEAGKAIRRIYTDGNLADDLDQAVSYFSDVSFSKPVIRTAELMAQYSDVFFYQFSYRFKVFGVPMPFGVYHGGEMLFLWKYLASLNNDDNILASQRILTVFTNFIKTSNPTPTEDPLLENIVLPKVTDAQFPYLDVGVNVTLLENPKNDYYLKWRAVYEEYGVPPYDTY